MASRNVDTFKAAHAAFNRRDFDAVVETMAPGFTYRDHARGATFDGREGFREFMQGWATAFSNARAADAHYIDGGDVVVALFVGRGTNDGPLGPMPATGREMELPLCEVMRFDGEGRVVSGELYYDQLTLMTQLGHAAAGA